jgi:hypothetical protein
MEISETFDLTFAPGESSTHRTPGVFSGFGANDDRSAKPQDWISSPGVIILTMKYKSG